MFKIFDWREFTLFGMSSFANYCTATMGLLNCTCLKIMLRPDEQTSCACSAWNIALLCDLLSFVITFVFLLLASIASFQYESSIMVDICCSRIVVNDDGGDLLGGFESGREERLFMGMMLLL